MQRLARGIVVMYVGLQMNRILQWYFVTVQNVLVIMNIARIIYLHIPISNNNGIVRRTYEQRRKTNH